MQRVVIHADGACSGNGTAHTRGGWAAIVALESTDSSKEESSKELSGGEPDTTNQRMELRAVIEGLGALTKPCVVAVFSDSTYVVNGMNQRWYVKWRANGWVNSKREPVANRDLWERLLEAVETRGHEVSFVKVKGHADALGRASTGHERLNQRCDELAVAATRIGSAPRR